MSVIFRYPKDMKTYDNDKQFMWGESLMIAPVLDQVSCTINTILQYISISM